MPDTDMLETEELERTESQTDKPEITEKPEPSPDRQTIFDEALSEGVEEGIIAQLAEKQGELTIEDLRQLPGTEDLSNEELLAQWKAIEAKEGTKKGEEEEVEAYKIPFPIYDKDGNNVDALEKISVKDLLDGRLTIGYNALGKEQKKTLAEALRNASQGHFNEQRYSTTVAERNEVHKKLTEATKQLEQYGTERKVWDAALTALAMGDIKPMERLARAYHQALMEQPQIPQAGMVPISQVQEDQENLARGVQYINEIIVPKGYEIAQRYGADAKEVVGAIRWYLEREPLEFLTEDKIQAILDYQIPAFLEEHGYRATGGGVGSAISGGNSEVEQLKKQIAALQSTVAETTNKQTETLRNKGKAIPPAGGGAIPSAGDSMPSFKSRSQMKAYLQGDPDWTKA